MSQPDARAADTIYLCPSDRAARGWRRHLTARGEKFRDCVATETWLAALWERAALFGLVADAPALALEVGPAAHQARRHVAKLRQFHLQLAFEGARALREDVEYQPRAIDDPAFQGTFEIALLGR